MRRARPVRYLMVALGTKVGTVLSHCCQGIRPSPLVSSKGGLHVALLHLASSCSYCHFLLFSPGSGRFAEFHVSC